MNSRWSAIAKQISTALGQPFHIQQQHAVGGGCINNAMVVGDGEQQFFVKLNDADRLSMFQAESDGLNELAKSASVRVPEPICSGTDDGSAFLVLEYLELHSADGHALELFGQQLAQLHRTTSEKFGWHRDNTIGSTPQKNKPDSDWVSFWRDQRLGYQLNLAANSDGRLMKKGERLLADLGNFFQSYRPAPSLLHGDLWGGNVAATGGHPVVFDPAVYYGDREADLAMTELFGGFSKSFYQSYQETWPLDPGYPVRKTLYNLYHVLNHFNLFGGGYAAQAGHMMDALLAEIRGR